MTNNLAYCFAVEKLGSIKVPERAEYLRVIFSEIMRISSHMMAVGFFLNDLGAMMTPVLYMWREREKIMDLFEMACGQRLLYNYMRIGGVSQDIPDDFMPAVKKFVAEMPKYIDEYDQLLAQNEILLARSKGVGILPRATAIGIGASGPVLRASGVKWDIRKADPYSIYDRFEFEVPVGDTGDCYDRYWVRMQEIRQSVKILEQALVQIPDKGPVCADVPQFFRPPKGESYGYLEAPKGNIGFYIVSDGSIAPYRVHIYPPTLINITALQDMVVGWKVADLIIIFGSIDVVLGEIDR
jgi:NADH-quinone oxidoreductase subunit D